MNYGYSFWVATNKLPLVQRAVKKTIDGRFTRKPMSCGAKTLVDVGFPNIEEFNWFTVVVEIIKQPFV